MSTTTTAVTILGKRKTRKPAYVLHLAATSESENQSQSDYEPPPNENGSQYESESQSDAYLPTPSSSSRPSKPPIVRNGSVVAGSSKHYACPFPGCPKAYTKPSRLAEHDRTHTGDRPFACATCSKSYLREAHLQAHARSHLPASERPFACGEDECEKRFWTTQHLRVHEETVHRGELPFKVCFNFHVYLLFPAP
jgi:general transcription factor IIIA